MCIFLMMIVKWSIFIFSLLFHFAILFFQKSNNHQSNHSGALYRSLCTFTHFSCYISFITHLISILSVWKTLQLIFMTKLAFLIREKTSQFIILDISVYTLLMIKYISIFSPNSYYRANSVRYETKPCDNVCSLNHYCAITRIDYREFKQCLDDSVAALASVKSNVLNINYQISLLLIVFIQIFLNRHMVLRILSLTWFFVITFWKDDRIIRYC